MPLLPSETFVHPPELLAAEAESSYFAAPPLLRWWVMHTKPRTEKALARRLLGRSVGFFLPHYEKQSINRGRRQCSYLPLFPGYLFVFGDHDARLAALETNLVINCLPVQDQRGLRDDLSRVYRLMTSDSPLSPEVRLGPGDPVEIVEGSLAGLRGRVLRCGKNLKLTVEVQFLRQGVSLQVERWMIQPIAEHAADAAETLWELATP